MVGEQRDVIRLCPSVLAGHGDGGGEGYLLLATMIRSTKHIAALVILSRRV